MMDTIWLIVTYVTGFVAGLAVAAVLWVLARLRESDE